MLNRIPNKLVYGGLLLGVIALFLWLATLSPSYQLCIAGEDHRYSNGEEKYLENKIAAFVECEATTMNENTGAITALATIAVAFFTLTLWIVTGDAVTLARAEFNAAHPPHLVVRNVWSPNATEDKPIEIEFEVINIGASDAIIGASSFEAHLVTNGTFYDIPLPTVGDPPTNVLGPVILGPSAVLRKSYKPGGNWTPTHMRIGLEGQGFFWGGKILYRDRANQPRRLGVFRRFQVSTKRFRSVPDDEYVYDD